MNTHLIYGLALAWTVPSLVVAQEHHPPVSAYVDVSAFPQDIVSSGEEDDPATPTVDESDILSRVGIRDFLYSEIQNALGVDIGATVTGKLMISSGFKLNVPGLDAIQLVIGEGEFSFELQAREEQAPDTYPFSLAVRSIPIRVRFKTDLLRPVKKNLDGSFQSYARDANGVYVDDANQPVYPDLVATVDFVARHTWDGEPEIFLGDPATNAPSVAFALSHPVMIGESGIVIEINGAQIDLSTTGPPLDLCDPANPTDICQPDWVGVAFGEFAVRFTNGLDVPEMGVGPTAPATPELASIALTNFYVGKGGFSGKISGQIDTSVNPLVVPLFGMEFELAGLDLEFRQNALISSGITGIIRDFPYFETDVKLELALDLEGNFKIGLAADDPNRNGAGIVEWEIPDVVRLQLNTISFEHREGVFLTRLSGVLFPEFFDGDVKPSADSPAGIEINGLTITSRGEVSIEGGWITLPAKRYLDFHAFKIELAQIGFGTVELPGGNDQRWLGFSGGIELVEGLSAAAKVKRLQFLWPRADGQPGVDLKLEGIEVGFSQPGVVTFSGAVEWFEDPTKKGFAGAVAIDLEFIQTSVSGRLVIGETVPNPGGGSPPPGATCAPPTATDAFKFFYLDLEAMLPTGIPVFSNVSIYGFMGLFAYNMEPHLCAFQSPLAWFKTYLGSKNVVAGSPPPWIPVEDAFAVGLGVMLGTTSDDGYAVNAKVALTVAVPGPVVILSGAGNIVEDRKPLRDPSDPAFAALAVFDGRQKVFLLNLGVHYLKPEPRGELVDLSVQAEAFFNLEDPNDWHLWLGKKSPKSERIRAQILSLFSSSAYLMLDPEQLQFGAENGYDSRPKWKFGPLRVTLTALWGFDAALAWRPTHAWGAIHVDGEASLKAFGVGIGLGAHAWLELATPNPFLIDGEFHVKMNLPWPLPDPSATVRFKWEKPAPKLPVDQLVTNVGLDASKTTGGVQAAITRGVTVTAGHAPSLSLCSPWQSMPSIPEIDEDLNNNGTLDPGEDFDGDGQLGFSSPEPTCTASPMVPIDYRPVIAFATDVNQALAGTGQPALVGHGGPYAETVENQTFRYDLTSLRLWAAPGTGSHPVFHDVLPNVYGAWPALVGDPQQPGALYVKLWSKNPFSIYESSTYLFYDNETGSWSDWFADTYSQYPCPQILPDVGLVAQASGFGAQAQQPVQIRQPDYPKGFTCVDQGWMTQDDLILPPYHSFVIATESEETGTGKDYSDAAYFYTEGPPLNLDPYVHVTVPENPHKLHYRSYDVGVRFNETWLDLVYKDPTSTAELVYKGPDQKLVVEIVDEHGEPVRDTDGNRITISTRWELAANHVRTRTDEAWLDLLRDHGVPIDAGIMPNDDIVYGRPDWNGGFGARQRYAVRVWLDDPRLLTDTRLTDEIWVRGNQIRRHDGQRVLLFDFPLTTSAFETFSALINSYEDLWWELPVPSFSPAVVDPVVNAARARTPPPITTVTNTDAGYIARFVASAAAPLGPDDLGPHDLTAWLARVPGYDDTPWDLTDAEQEAIVSAWKSELNAFLELDTMLMIDRSREPLPEQLEVSVLTFSNASRGLLLEFPESVDWSRVELGFRGPRTLGGPDENLEPAVIVDRMGARAFVFATASGTATTLVDGSYTLEFVYQRSNGERNAVLRAPDGLASETATMIVHLPDGHFVPEVP